MSRLREEDPIDVEMEAVQFDPDENHANDEIFMEPAKN